MLISNIDLLHQIAKKEKQYSLSSFKREKKVLIVVLSIFEFSYLFRFVFDLVGPDIISNKTNYFEFFLLQDVTYVLEAGSFLALLTFHKRNFKPVAKQSS